MEAYLLPTSDMLPDPETIPATEANDQEDIEAAATDQSSGIAGQSEMLSGSSDTLPEKPRTSRRQPNEAPAEMKTADLAAPPSAHSPAVRWDMETATPTFDWSSIEQVAATDGPNQTMAKLLLAARAEGANSRWPF